MRRRTEVPHVRPLTLSLSPAYGGEGTGGDRRRLPLSGLRVVVQRRGAGVIILSHGRPRYDRERCAADGGLAVPRRQGFLDRRQGRRLRIALQLPGRASHRAAV